MIALIRAMGLAHRALRRGWERTTLLERCSRGSRDKIVSAHVKSKTMKGSPMQKSLFAAVLGGWLAWTGLAAPASAAPLAAGALAAATQSSTGLIAEVHYRPYRHCHWRYGRRWCHGPHYYGGWGGYGYYGIYPRHRYWRHRHHRHHHHHHRGRRR
jgi:hypothetical protein